MHSVETFFQVFNDSSVVQKKFQASLNFDCSFLLNVKKSKRNLQQAFLLFLLQVEQMRAVQAFNKEVDR